MPTFSFSQVGVKAIEFQAMPGPEARALRAKTMKARLVSWIGRALYLAWYRAGRPFFLREERFSDVRTAGRAPERPAPFCGS